jgi:hypothetical protein
LNQGVDDGIIKCDKRGGKRVEGVVAQETNTVRIVPSRREIGEIWARIQQGIEDQEAIGLADEEVVL